MTRSEAIDMLRQICSYLTAGNPMWRTEPIREACDMAIEALAEKDPTMDEIVARKITEEANKACAECQEWSCDECEYRHWRNYG